MTDVPVDQLPVGESPIAHANALVEQALTKIGIPIGPSSGNQGSPTPVQPANWPAVRAAFAYDWPGYDWPAKYDPEQVEINLENIANRLRQWTTWNYEATLALQLEANLLYQKIVVLESNVSALEYNAPQAQQISGLTGQLAALQTELNTVAKNAWDDLWALYKNQVVPLVTQAEQTAWDNLWALYHDQVLPAIATGTQQSINAAWQIFYQHAVPLIAQEATARAQADSLLSQGLTREQAVRQAQTNTLHSDIASETSARVAADQNITNAVIPGAIAALATQVQTQMAPLRTEIETCLAPLCDTVTPNAKQLGNLGGLLKGLAGLFEAGALAALLTAAVKDPKGTAAAVDDVAGWMPKLAIDLVNAIDEGIASVL